MKSSSRVVIAAEAGIQVCFSILDSRFHGNDGLNQTGKRTFQKAKLLLVGEFSPAGVRPIDWGVNHA
jgi:hypothetical protein